MSGELTGVERYGKARGVLLVTLGISFLLAVAKLSLGYVTGTASMVADGLHSLSDCMSGAASIIGVSIAAKPRDAAYPYGHEKFETIASVAIGMMLLLVAIDVVYAAVEGFCIPRHPR